MKNSDPIKATLGAPYNEHKDIPGNPSKTRGSKVNLRTEVTKDSLRVLSLEQWGFGRNTVMWL